MYGVTATSTPPALVNTVPPARPWFSPSTDSGRELDGLTETTRGERKTAEFSVSLCDCLTEVALLQGYSLV